MYKEANFDTILSLDTQVFSRKDEPCNPKHQWWVIREAGITMGYAGAAFISRLNYVYLSRAGVLPEFRGRGLHKRLLDARVKWAKKQGADAIITYTVADNARSANTLISRGFKWYVPEDAWAGRGVVYWIKELKK